MSNPTIEISGITPLPHFPKCPPHHPCTEFCEIDYLYLPRKKHIGRIQHITLTVCINSFKIICTPAGKKLVIYGKKQIRILFSSLYSNQPIYAGDYEIPFCTFILLKDIHDEVAEICTVVEDITLSFLDCRHFTLTSIIFLCPIFKKNHELCPCPPPPVLNQLSQIDAKCLCHNEEHEPPHYSCNAFKHLNQCHLYKIQATCKHCRTHDPSQ